MTKYLIYYSYYSYSANAGRFSRMEIVELPDLSHETLSTLEEKLIELANKHNPFKNSESIDISRICEVKRVIGDYVEVEDKIYLTKYK